MPYEEIVVQTADTDTGPHYMGTFASRGTHRVGNAVKVAAAEARELGPAARVGGAGGRGRRTSSSTARAASGSSGSPDKSLGIADLASRAQFQYGRTIAGRGACG